MHKLKKELEHERSNTRSNWQAIYDFVTDPDKVDSYYSGTLDQFKQENPLWSNFQSDQYYLEGHILSIMGQLGVQGPAPNIPTATYTIQDSVDYIESLSQGQQGTGT